MASLSPKPSVPGQGEKGTKPEQAPRFFSDSSTFVPPKEKNAVGISGFGKDDSDKSMFTSSGFRRRDEVNPYADEVRQRRAGEGRGSAIAVMVVALVLLFIAVLILPYGLLDNPRGITLSGIIASITRNAHDLMALFTDPSSAGSEEVIVSHYLCVVLAGASLGVTGAVYQGSLKNALASPTTLGVDTGASLGAVAYMLLFGTFFSGATGFIQISDLAQQVQSLSSLEYVWFLYGKAFCAIIGSFAIVVLVLFITRLAGHGQISGLWLIVTGMIVSTLASSVQSLMSTYFTDMGMTHEESLLESVSTETFSNIFSLTDVLLVAIPTIVCLVLIFSIRVKLGLLTFGDDEARSMGVNPKRMRVIAIGITTVMTAVITAFCGNISFLGFLVPHITRRFIGSDFRYLLPGSALAGSIILLVCYYVMTLFSTSGGNYVGLVTSVVGFVVFIVMFIKQQGVGGRVQVVEA